MNQQPNNEPTSPHLPDPTRAPDQINAAEPRADAQDNASANQQTEFAPSEAPFAAPQDEFATRQAANSTFLVENTTFEALPAVEMPPSASGMPDSASEMPPSASGMPLSALEMPDSASEMPPSVPGMPLSALEMPDSASKTPSSAAEMSPPLWEMSLEVTDVPPQVTYESHQEPDSTARVTENVADSSEDEANSFGLNYEAANVAAETPVVVLSEPTIEIAASEPQGKSNMAARVITALIGIPLVALVVWSADAPVFNGVVAFLALLGLRELGKAMSDAGTPLISSLAYPALLALLFVQPLTQRFPRWGGLMIWILPFFLMIFLLISGVQRYPTQKRVSLHSLALTLFATLYVGLFAFLILLRSLRASPLDFLDDGPRLGYALLWLTIVSVWAGDIVAYFAGRKFGRDKLTPLSPGKTWEGAIAGLVATMAVCVPVSRLMHLELQDGLACAILIALAAPLGDLSESFWKRELQIKDSGGVLPGHGGILDRCDSLLFSVFAVYLYALVFML